MTLQRTKLAIGTRESKLALLQTDQIVEQIEKLAPNLEIEIVHITTGGDKVLDRPISALGGRGVFVKELEEALLDGRVDLVVHSLKDLPTDLPTGLMLAAVLNRVDARDVFLSHKAESFMELPSGSTVATSSRRRVAQLKALRSDLNFVDMRGNIPTRVRKLEEGQCDAMILAAAGLVRLDLSDKIKEFLDTDKIVPAAGQGVLAVECRGSDQDIVDFLKGIEDGRTRQAVDAERACLDHLGGGCSVPAGVFASFKDELLQVTGCVASLDGSQIFKDSVQGPPHEAAALGLALAKALEKLGADRILNELRASIPNVVSPP
ncbi:MAG: hydroxymethylbilane synthase [Candidatus Obscuribacterales bacterium]|nr:hydroxymethylbilane synthase [Candidatus Obscuribacterales bacterium]